VISSRGLCVEASAGKEDASTPAFSMLTGHQPTNASEQGPQCQMRDRNGRSSRLLEVRSEWLGQSVDRTVDHPDWRRRLPKALS